MIDSVGTRHEAATRRRNESGYRGVYKINNKRMKKPRWYASFRGVYLGSYDTPEKAAKAYNKVVIAAGYSAFANTIPGEPEIQLSSLEDVESILNQE